MSDPASGRAIVASTLDWEQAHASFDRAVEGLSPELRGRRPPGVPYSIWQLLEHIRLAQRDLLDFCRDPEYVHDLDWPDDYWPKSPEPPSDEAWDQSLATILEERAAFKRWTEEADVDLTGEIPWGSGQTYLRTVIVAVDHMSYHVGQIVLIRKLLGAWG